jgi:hypothetical protein
MPYRGWIVFAMLTVVAAGAPGAQADYALLRSGARLHITGYETAGDRVKLMLPGGVVEITAGELVSIEPEDRFMDLPSPAPATTPYGEFIRAAAEKHGLDEKLITRLIAVESNFDPNAVSRKQALGLMQLLPQTAAQYAVANVLDPAQNIEGGVHYLKDLLDKYRGNLTLALAAYNAGPDMVARYRGVPPFAETRHYLERMSSELAKPSPLTIR